MNTGTIGATSLARHLSGWRSVRSHEPAYRQLASALRLLVRDGRVPLGTRVAGEREMAQALDISRTTVTAAYALLRDQGYLRSRQGSGSVTTLPDGIHRARDIMGHDPGPDNEDSATINWTSAALPASEAVLHAYEAAVADLPCYLGRIGYDALGITALRERIAARYSTRGCATDASQIMVTSGAQSALSLLLWTLARPGDRVVIDHPTYHNAIGAIQRAACQAVPVGMPDMDWDLEALDLAFRQASPRLAYIIADQHNPTGRTMTRSTRAYLVDFAARSRVRLVIDECMADMWLDHPPPEPVATHDSTGSTVISIGSLGKTFWGGMRIGWIRADRDTIAALASARASFDMATPVIDQLAASHLLAQPESALDDRRTMLRHQRDHLAMLLTRHLPDWQFALPDGGLCLWARMPAPVSTALAALCENMGLRIAPGPRFGTDGAFEHYVRLPFTLDSAVMEPAVERLALAWGQLRPGTAHRGMRMAMAETIV